MVNNTSLGFGPGNSLNGLAGVPCFSKYRLLHSQQNNGYHMCRYPQMHPSDCLLPSDNRLAMYGCVFQQ